MKLMKKMNKKLGKLVNKILRMFGYDFCDFCGIRITKNKKTLYYIDDEDCIMPEGDYFICSLCEKG